MNPKLKELKSVLKSIKDIQAKLALLDQLKYKYQIDEFEQKLLWEITNIEFDEALTAMLEQKDV